MIILDADIISTFAKVGKLELLCRLFRQRILHISTNVEQELKNAESKGYVFVESVWDLIRRREIKVVTLTKEEFSEMSRIPPSFGSGEVSSLVIAKKRKWRLLSNDQEIINFCEREKIDYSTLPGILRALWISGVLPKDEVWKLIQEIEEKDNIRFKAVSRIFEDWTDNSQRKK